LGSTGPLKIKRLTIWKLDSLRHVVYEISGHQSGRRSHNLTIGRDKSLLSTNLNGLGIRKLCILNARYKECLLTVHGHRLHWLEDLEHSVWVLDDLAALYELWHGHGLWGTDALSFDLNELLGEVDNAGGLSGLRLLDLLGRGK
jgi:hypothetical protein